MKFDFFKDLKKLFCILLPEVVFLSLSMSKYSKPTPFLCHSNMSIFTYLLWIAASVSKYRSTSLEIDWRTRLDICLHLVHWFQIFAQINQRLGKMIPGFSVEILSVTNFLSLLGQGQPWLAEWWNTILIESWIILNTRTSVAPSATLF